MSVSSPTASTAVSSVPDQRPGRLTAAVCAIHQPNLFPRLSTLAKLYTADVWIVYDDVQFVRRDYQHRARLAQLNDPRKWQWLSLPTHLPHGRDTLISDAHLVEPFRSQQRVQRLLQQLYSRGPYWLQLQERLGALFDLFEITDRTAAIAKASTLALLRLLDWDGTVLHSRDLPARKGRSLRLADLCSSVNASTYLCGSGGLSYLDTAPFEQQAISVESFLVPEHGVWEEGHRVSALRAIATHGPDALRRHLITLREQLWPAARFTASSARPRPVPPQIG
ncbi:WbqC family protein [Kitasatospora sp. NPDC056138]|uniref:WbqC family protein n=1 Tax=Kitasatospora sp. NPDC056138 TaxID=3345724 RepID=UPI0035DF617F